MLMFLNKFVKIELIDNKTILKITWKGLVPSKVYKEANDIALDIAIAYELSDWITDTRSLEAIRVEAQDWLINDWFPRAIKSGYYKRQAIYPPTYILAKACIFRILRLADLEEIEVVNANYVY